MPTETDTIEMKQSKHKLQVFTTLTDDQMDWFERRVKQSGHSQATIIRELIAEKVEQEKLSIAQ